jgi:ABC-type dipeptide/oligopeptide/nickel transport system permease component
VFCEVVELFGGGGGYTMLTYISRRIALGILTIFFVLSFIFVAIRLVPGDAADAMLGDYATPELIELMRIKWGLDKPIWSQYLKYFENIFRGELGESLFWQVPVVDLLKRNYPFTARLVIVGTLLSIMIAVPIGILAAIRQNSFADMSVMMLAFIFISVPSFWFGLMAIFFFSFRLGWFPSMGGESGGDLLVYLSYLVLPSTVWGLRHAGALSRMVRSTMIDTLSMDYIAVERSKGLSERVIRYKHALRNALAPIVSLLGVTLVLSFAGSVVLEVVFTRPGLGRLYVQAIGARDYPLIQGCMLIIATAVVAINMIVDISYGIIDPRIRYD